MTGRDLINAAARKIGVLAEGETLSAQGAIDALAELNRMLGNWSTQGLLVRAVTREEFTLTPGTQAYTMGTGATFSTTRPQEIVRAGLVQSNGGEDVEYPMDLLTAEQWAEIQIKATESSLPRYLYAEGTYPNERLNFYPVPDTAHDVAIYSRKPLTSVATLNTAISVEPGHEDAMVYGLAVRLAPEYGKPLDPRIEAMANSTYADIKRQNYRTRLLKCDPALVEEASYDIYRGPV